MSDVKPIPPEIKDVVKGRLESSGFVERTNKVIHEALNTVAKELQNDPDARSSIVFDPLKDMADIEIKALSMVCSYLKEKSLCNTLSTLVNEKGNISFVSEEATISTLIKFMNGEDGEKEEEDGLLAVNDQRHGAENSSSVNDSKNFEVYPHVNLDDDGSEVKKAVHEGQAWQSADDNLEYGEEFRTDEGSRSPNAFLTSSQPGHGGANDFILASDSGFLELENEYTSSEKLESPKENIKDNSVEIKHEMRLDSNGEVFRRIDPPLEISRSEFEKNEFIVNIDGI